MNNSKRIFSLQDANRRLPLVRKIVGDILRKGKEFRQIVQAAQGKEVSAQVLNLKAEIEGLIAELEDLGCYYKDWNFEIGLVDFPSIIDGKEVLLCYRSDEQEITWYHSLDSGFAGRLPIPHKLLADHKSMD